MSVVFETNIRDKAAPSASFLPVSGKMNAVSEFSPQKDLSSVSRESLVSAPPLTQPEISQCPSSPMRCPFGGACHVCPAKLQPKLKVGQPDDEYEREADRMAETVMRMSESKDNDEEECKSPGCAKTLQRQAMGKAANIAPSSVQEVLNSPGQPLDSGTRAFMEPRFGHDFSQVRVHSDVKAAESAQSINALAYTVGNDMVFGSGQYHPATANGQRLLGHELAHVVQQEGSTTGHIQRWSYGSGLVPHPDYKEVPAKHRPRIEEGMNLISRVVNNPKDYPVCHKFFEKNCAVGTSTSLVDEFNTATLWLDIDNSVWGSGVKGDNVAYSDATYRMGRWFIGSVMIHEFMHRCGQNNESIDDQAILKCGFRDVEIINGKVVEKK